MTRRHDLPRDEKAGRDQGGRATTFGIVFVGDELYDPASGRPALADDEHAIWVLFKFGEAEANRLDELYEAIAGRDGWRRHARTAYVQHAICRRNGVTCIVFRFRDEAGWRWQVWRDGDHKPVRSAREQAATTAHEAVRLAEELAAKAERRRTRSVAAGGGG